MIDDFPLLQTGHDKAVAEIVHLNSLIRLYGMGESASLNAAKKLFPKLYPESRKRTGISEIEKKRRQREPFLYAAKRVAPEFLGMDFESTGGKDRLITPDGLISQVTNKAENRDKFRKLCSAAKAIAPMIQVELSTEVANALDSVESQLPEVDPIPPELLPKQAARRAAPETKRADRQWVGN